MVPRVAGSNPVIHPKYNKGVLIRAPFFCVLTCLHRFDYLCSKAFVMQELMYVFPVLLGAIMILGVASAIVRNLQKRDKPRWVLALVITFFIGLTFVMFKVIYNPYGMYKGYFYRAGHKPLPADAEFLYADSWDGEHELQAIMRIKLNDEARFAFERRLFLNGFNDFVEDDVRAFEKLDHNIAAVMDGQKGLIIEREYFQVENLVQGNGHLRKDRKRLKFYVGFLNDKSFILYGISNTMLQPES